jgi:hypothetical protein
MNQFPLVLYGVVILFSSRSFSRSELAMNNLPILLVSVLVVLIRFFNSLNVLRKYERGVIFRIRRYLQALTEIGKEKNTTIVSRSRSISSDIS